MTSDAVKQAFVYCYRGNDRDLSRFPFFEKKLIWRAFAQLPSLAMPSLRQLKMAITFVAHFIAVVKKKQVLFAQISHLKANSMRALERL